MKPKTLWLSKQDIETYDNLIHKCFRRSSGILKELSLDVTEAHLIYMVLAKVRRRVAPLSQLRIKVVEEKKE